MAVGRWKVFTMHALIRLAIAALYLAVIDVGQPVTAEPFTLDAVRTDVRQKYGGVAQLSTDALAKMLDNREPVLLLDVRERKEFAVSRIPGAVRVDPGMWSWSFMKRFGGQANAKKVIFYCSVGVRSSELAKRVQDALKAGGARAVYNLDGGIFAWHNERRRLANRKGDTPFVHPFDDHWGKLIERSALIRTAPVP